MGDSVGSLPFSIVVPAYQAAETIAETLDGVLGQSFDDWECIVVDDGSTDGTLGIAESYAVRDPRVRVVHQANAGTAAAYNTGVAMASGDYVVICSSDDVLLRHHLARVSEVVSGGDKFDIYSSNGYYWYPDGSRVLVYAASDLGGTLSLSLSQVLTRCFFSVGATFRRELFNRVGGYRRGVYGEDYDFWLRAMALGARHRYIPEPLSLHRVSFVQKSARLRTVLQSDIRLITDLVADFPLGPAELAAADSAIRTRQRTLHELDHLGVLRGVVRPLVKRVLVGALGPGRAWHVVRAVKRVLGEPQG